MKRTIKRVTDVVRSYKLFFFALTAICASGVLQVAHRPYYAHWVLGTVSIITVLPLVAKMWRDVRNGTYGVDILAATAIVTAVALRQYWAGIIIVVMLSGGESLEAFAARRARSELRDLLRHRPQTAHLIVKKQVVDVASGKVSSGDQIVIKPGEVVAVDAVIVDGTGSFDEARLTGESLPVTKEPGDEILSGSVNIDGVITAKALRPADESQYQQIVRLVQAAADNPAPYVRLADRYSIPFTVIAYTIAGVVWILSHHAIRFLEVIIVATPCPLILAAPIALIAGMSRASREGIIIKTGTALEKLAQAKTFAFDKTGTLTRGTPEVEAVVAFAPYSETDVLAYAASIERGSNHILAKAIIQAAVDKKLKAVKAKHIKEIAGFGLESHIAGNDVLVGRYGLLKDRGVKMPKEYKNRAVKQTAALVAINSSLAGYITFIDNIRPDAKQTLKQLRALGVKHTMMVTGDNRTVATYIADELGITDVFSEALPSDKIRAVEAVADRPIAFVGDGINDAPVLTLADVGIALGARGSTAASESADIVIMRNNLTLVARARAIARRAFLIASQSILFGIGLSIALMLVFATGKFPPLYGAILQEFVDVFVILNALRAHRMPAKR